MEPAEQGVTELRSTDLQFDKVLSYQRYRLQNPDNCVYGELSSTIVTLRRVLNHSLKDRTFTSAKPIGILEFLATFKRQCLENGFSEGAAMLLLPSFLEDESTDSLLSHFDIGMDDLAGFHQHPPAVQL